MQQSLSERIFTQLRSLYSSWGYSPYTMSKFEEYDLYARNKDFLISDSVITFTDRSGKLMALKPDVTLSIVKNSRDEAAVQKLYYNENVYRVAKGADSFKEIMQVGLECIGPIDDYAICEVLLLAAESLRRICPNAVLDISHLGLLEQLLDGMGVSQEGKRAMLRCIGEKNRHELAELCESFRLPEADTAILCALVELCGTPGKVLPRLKALLGGRAQKAIQQLERIFTALEDQQDILRLDLSVVDDLHYYNGIVFKGFVAGVPASVLSGGQYDKLMRKMKRSSGAIGFAVYMDMLERLESEPRKYDVDVVLLYERHTDPAQVRAEMDRLTAGGESVMAQTAVPENIRYGRLVRMGDAQC